MNARQVRQILKDTDFTHESGSAEELKVAEYLKARCEALGIEAHLEAFEVENANVKKAVLTAGGVSYHCEAYLNCGSGTVEAPLLYMPTLDPASLTRCKGCIVLLDSGVGKFTYKDLSENGAIGFITYNGNAYYPNHDIRINQLRSYTRDGHEKMLGVTLNVKDAVKLVESGAKTARIEIEQDEFVCDSHNVVAEIPGKKDEWIVLSAHYDSTALSKGAYDNMTGCIGLLGVLEAMKKTAPNNYGVRAVFCGSEERGLLGSKAYVRDHKDELEKIALNVNLDMIGTYMGHFIARVSAEEALASYIKYLAMEQGFGLEARTGIYSSDSTPFADNGVPAFSFARNAGNAVAPIHVRYDTMKVVSPEQCLKDIAFITLFVDRMANAFKCPVSREIPQSVKDELEEYMGRKRKK